MKILHLIDSSGFYGAERVIINLCNQLKLRNYIPIIGCITPPYDEMPEIANIARDNGIKVVQLKQKTKYSWKSIKNLIDSTGIDILHCHGYKPSILSYLAQKCKGERIIITCHLWTKETLRLKVYSMLEAFIMRFAMKIVAVSEEIKSEIISKGVNKDKVLKIQNGIDVDEWMPIKDFNFIKERIDLGVSRDTVLLGIFGRLDRQKGHFYLFDAVKDIKEKEIEIICVGTGPLEKELKIIIDKFNIETKVHFLGFRNDIKRIMQLIDIFVMPSLDEGLPMALLEAMAMEKAIIVTPVGEIPYVIRNNIDGVLIQKKESGLLKKNILSLIENKEKRLLLGQNARKRVKNKYSSHIMTERYKELYIDMLKNNNAQRGPGIG